MCLNIIMLKCMQINMNMFFAFLFKFKIIFCADTLPFCPSLICKSIEVYIVVFYRSTETLCIFIVIV